MRHELDEHKRKMGWTGTDNKTTQAGSESGKARWGRVFDFVLAHGASYFLYQTRTGSRLINFCRQLAGKRIGTYQGIGTQVAFLALASHRALRHASSTNRILLAAKMPDNMVRDNTMQGDC